MENTWLVHLAFRLRLFCHTHMRARASLYRNIKPLSQRRNCHTIRKTTHTIGVTSLCRWYSTSRYECVRAHAQALHIASDIYFTALIYSPISLSLLFILFSPFFFLSFFLLHLSRCTTVPYYDLLLGSPLSGLGGSHVPWLQRGKITLTHWLTHA